MTERVSTGPGPRLQPGITPEHHARLAEANAAALAASPPRPCLEPEPAPRSCLEPEPEAEP
jgi:hypothetical protein